MPKCCKSKGLPKIKKRKRVVPMARKKAFGTDIKKLPAPTTQKTITNLSARGPVSNTDVLMTNRAGPGTRFAKKFPKGQSFTGMQKQPLVIPKSTSFNMLDKASSGQKTIDFILPKLK